MPREYLGSPGSSSSQAIVPITQTGTGSTRRVFPHILDAISQIEQFYVIEASGDPIPDEFLTIRGKLNFFNVGFGAGFLEALIFAFLMSIIMILVSDPETREAIARYFPLIRNNVFLWSANLMPVLISGGLCCYLSRLYIGTITRKAINALLIGRVFSMGLKALLLFFVMIWVSRAINPTSAWTAAKWMSFRHEHFAMTLYYTFMAMKPLLVNRAFELLGIFGTAILMPFIFIWFVAWFRKLKAARNRSIMEA